MHHEGASHGFIGRCPNLNLIERLWKLVKKRRLTNRYYPTFDDFRHAIADCVNALNSTTDELRTLLTLNFQFFSMPPLETRFRLPSQGL
jgi:hypothetical protein